MRSVRLMPALFLVAMFLCAACVNAARREPQLIQETGIDAAGRGLLVVPRGGVELKKYQAAQADNEADGEVDVDPTDDDKEEEDNEDDQDEVEDNEDQDEEEEDDPDEDGEE
mmetsp:Transcript_14872/g.41807  ORF Transcript_14872/g.41807 Transcript_14872/m.41807 type:complete len:112 (+) Transcript_14872:201-536(+)